MSRPLACAKDKYRQGLGGEVLGHVGPSQGFWCGKVIDQRAAVRFPEFCGRTLSPRFPGVLARSLATALKELNEALSLSARPARYDPEIILEFIRKGIASLADELRRTILQIEGTQ